MLSKLFWFALGAGFMRYTMNRQGRSLRTAGAGLGSQVGALAGDMGDAGGAMGAIGGTGAAGGASGSMGGSAGSGQGLPQSGPAGYGTDVSSNSSMLADDDGQGTSLQPESTGSGIEGARSRSGEQGAEKAYT